MPRLPRIHLENVLYYANLEGPVGEPVFRDEEDYSKYCGLLSQAKKEFSFRLFAYSLLPDSLQLVIEPNAEFPISQIMQKITPNYTRYYNSKYGRKGHLFAKRFRSVMVEKENYLARLARFVHHLPVSAGLAASERDYRYSSYGTYLTAAGAPGFPVPVDMRSEINEVVSSLPGFVPEDSFERFSLSLPDNELEYLGKKLGRGSFLGSDEFVAGVKREMAAHLAGREIAEPVVAMAAPAPAAAAHVLAPAGRSYRTALLSCALVATVGFSVFSYSLNRDGAKAPVRETAPAVKIEMVDRDPMVGRAVPIRFEAPISGTMWDIQLYTISADGKMTPIQDKIHFDGKSFNSNYLSSKGFYPSNYTVRMNKNGSITWETVQRNSQGEMVSWHGDWQGNRMEGVMSYQSENSNAKDFSFMSNQLGSQAVQHG